MEDYFKRIDISRLYPPFAEKLKKLVDNCLKRKAPYFIISGMRTPAEQMALYELGRTKVNSDGYDPVKKPMGNIVTKARPLTSAHNFGLAGDGCKDKDMTRAGLQPDFNKESYKVWAEEAKKLGLDVGFYWNFVDAPHVQLNLSKHNIKLSELAVLYKEGGFPKVFEHLDKFDWK